MTRFKVTCISGWGVRQGGHGASGRKQTATAWQVLDSANCFQIVREFRLEGNQHRRGDDPESAARTLAAELEAMYP